MSTPDPHDPAGASLPDVIQRYLRAHDARDTSAALATFTHDATVTDDGDTVGGHQQIRGWLGKAASQFTYERTLLEVTSPGSDEWVALNNITGNFPGGTVDLTYRFTLDQGLIQALVIAPVG